MKTKAFLLTLLLALPAAAAEKPGKFVDLSLMVAREYPCTWPTGFPRFYMTPYLRIGPQSAYNSEVLQIDGNTGTQIDVPPHSIPRPGTGLPDEGPLGLEFTDKTPPWKLVGEACVLDLRVLRDKAPKGVSPLVQPAHIKAWEKKHRPLRFGDHALLRFDYSDKYYKPMPAGRRFLVQPLMKQTPAWPDPHPDAMAYMASRKVTAVGTDSPSMGPIPDLAGPTHTAGLKHGLVFTEGAIGLGQLPTTGAFYCMMGPRHAGGPYGEGRAFAIVGGPVKRLIASARAKRAIELSVVMGRDLPLTFPGAGVYEHRHPYSKVDFFHSKELDLYHHTHLMDSHAGTHLVPPAYALPPKGFDNAKYSPEVRAWLKEYEAAHGKRGHSTVTAEQVPLSQTCGPARVVDVRRRIGTTKKADWPASPEITVADLRAAEKKDGPFKPGDIVVFHTGHVDRHFKKLPAGSTCFADPLAGKTEGWPAPAPAAIAYLAKKGIRCLATDAPMLGSAHPKAALMTYWKLGTENMVAVEYLHNVSALKKGAYFLFAPVKIKGCHGGPGRAIALY